MPEFDARVWQSSDLARTYIDKVRGGIPFGADQLDVMLRVIGTATDRVDRFLDLGCGSGALAVAVLSRYPDASGVLLDFSDAMLDAARQTFADRADSLRFVSFDYGDPKWVDAVRQDAPFDAIVSGYSIHHQTDARKRAIYAEIHDLLDEGGVFVNVEHVASATPFGRALFDDCFVDTQHAHLSGQGDTVTRDEVRERYVNRPDKAANILASVEAQCGWLRDIGYRDVDCYFKVFELAVFGGVK